MNIRLAWLPVAVGFACTSPSMAARDDGPAACPSGPTRVVRSAGGTNDYDGVFKGIPELCHVARADGQGFFYYGVWRTDWPGAGDAFPALRAVLFGAKGTKATFTTHSAPGMQWVDTLTNEGQSTLTVEGRAHAVLQIAHEREGFDGNTYHSIITSWRDIASGVTLKTVENQIAGQSYGPATTWTAVRVEPMRSASSGKPGAMTEASLRATSAAPESSRPSPAPTR